MEPRVAPEGGHPLPFPAMPGAISRTAARGRVMTDEARGTSRWAWRDGLYVVLVLGAILVLFGGVVSRTPPTALSAGSGRPRNVDAPLLRQLIDRGQLSDHEAQFCRPLPD